MVLVEEHERKDRLVHYIKNNLFIWSNAVNFFHENTQFTLEINQMLPPMSDQIGTS